MNAVTRVILIAVSGVSVTFGAPDIPDYRLFAPGACVEQNPSLHSVWREALAALEARRYGEAVHKLSSALAICPDDGPLRHQAALAAWGIGERPIALRWLVLAFRKSDATPATAAALAALNAEAATESVAIGWLRRGLVSADVEERAFWLTRDSFTKLWERDSAEWRALLAELGVPQDRAVARAMGARPMKEWVPAPAAPQQPPLLRLAPFSPDMDTIDRTHAMQEMTRQRLIDRIRPPTGVVVEAQQLVVDELNGAASFAPEEP
jgi:hypothetical protein